MADTFLTEEIKSKWAKVINHADLPEIKESWKKRVTAICLENTSREVGKSAEYMDQTLLSEAAPANAAGAFPRANLQGFDPVSYTHLRAHET